MKGGVARSPPRCLPCPPAGKEQEYVEEKLSEAGKNYGQSCDGADKILIEMDGCELRTGILKLSENSEQTTVHGNPKKEKVISKLKNIHALF